MVAKYKIEFEYESKEPPNCFWGYNLYGALMQKLPAKAAERLHENGISPLSQYVTVDRGNNLLIWHVTVAEDINGQMEETLSRTKEYKLDGHEAVLRMAGFEKTAEIGHIDMALAYLHEKIPARHLRIKTYTPVSFKTDGEYAIFPSVELIYKSATQKWNAFAEDVIIDDDDVLKQLIENTRIVSYRLNSFYYQIKGVKIPSFFGDVTLYIKGQESLVRMADLVLNYLEFSGLGIKCALGMGGVKITDCTEEKTYKRR